uniref:Uncharacterized protein n=1 Tax=viral metagenome TaxID=1070528 RepID=A0A6C0C917_9ZZZZ
MDSLSPDIYPLIFRKSSTFEMMSYRLVNHHGNCIVRKILMQHLPFICTNKITDDQVAVFKHAQMIDLRLCRQISDIGLSHLKCVKVLNLRGCHKITDMGLKYIQNVVALNITGCDLVTSKGLRQLEKLKYINVSYLEKKEYHFMVGKVKIINEKNMHEIVYDYPILSNKDVMKIPEPTLNEKSYASCKSDCVQVYPESIWDYENNSDELQEIRSRLKLFSKIYNKQLYVNEDADELLGNYRNLLPHTTLNSKKKALSKLYAINPYMRMFVKKVKIAGLDILIAGSAALSCVWKTAQFVPNDLDIYILDLQCGDLQKLEDVLYQTFDIAHCAVVQNPLTTTFHIQVFSGEIYSIQLNMFNIKSWAQIFVVYHSNITCIGYEILTNRFLYMQDRFENVLHCGTQYFSNILNFDSEDSLSNAASKYASRGFRCKHVRIAEKYEMYYSNKITRLLTRYYNYQHCMSSPSPHYLTGGFVDIIGKSLKYNNRISSISASFNNQILPIMYLSIYITDRHAKKGSKCVDMDMAKEYFKYERSQNTQQQNRIFKSCRCDELLLPFNSSECCCGEIKKALFII